MGIVWIWIPAHDDANRFKAVACLGILCDEWSEAQVKAFRLIVNRSVGWADWDEELLSLEILDLKELDFDLSLTGFDSREIDGFLASTSSSDEKANACPELPEHPATRPGDMWLCGPHWLLCGDGTVEPHVSRLLTGTTPFLMVTDPPYGVSLAPEWREESGLNPRTVQSGKVANDDQFDWTPAWKLFPGDVAYGTLEYTREK